jgi:hypothetical protein
MSGTAALAAAKRRRAVPDVKPSTGPPPPQSTSSNYTNQSQGQTQGLTSVQGQGPVNPLNVLIKHDKQLLDLETKLGNIKIEKTAPMSTEDIAYFKSQYNTLVEEIQELKKIIIKVQTFSMEMNIELLNIKRLLKNDTRLNEVSEIENDIKPAE